MENIPNHKWSFVSAKAAVSRFNLRKPYELKDKTSKKEVSQKRTRPLKICPVPGCERVVKRVDEHLKSKFHKEDVTSPEEFRAYCKAAVVFDSTLTSTSSSPGKLYLKQNLDAGSKVRSKLSKKFTPLSQLLYPKLPESVNVTEIAASNSLAGSPNKSNHTEPLTPITPEPLPIPEITTPPSSLAPEHLLLSVVELEACPDNATTSAGSSSDDNDPDFIPSPLKHLNEDMESIFKKFFDFLNGPDVNRNHDSCQQVVGDLRRICRVVNASSLADLFKKNFIRDNYLYTHCREKCFTAETIKKYLRTLIDFSNFLLSEEPLSEVSSDDALRMKILVTEWIKRQSKTGKMEAWQKVEEKRKVLVDDEQINIYESGENARSARKYFNILEKGEILNLTKSIYITMRDHLFIQIHFSNGNRSGVTANLTVQEFQDARKEDEFYVVGVKKHKTYYTNGPAILTFTQSQYFWMKTFLEKVRIFVRPTVDNFFAAFSGEAMKPGAISNQLNTQWIKAGILDGMDGRRICGNTARRSLSTGVRDKNLGNYQELADSMSHSIKTAEMHYALRRKEKSAIIARKTVNKLYPSQGNITPKKKWSELEVKKLQEVFENTPEKVPTSSFVNKTCNDSDICKDLNASPTQIHNKLKSLSRYSPSQKV